MNTPTPCGPALCDSAPLERPRYFPRQLVSDVELTLDQGYFRQRMKMHNRMLHGWGVVCGALVCPAFDPCGGGPQPWKVQVQPGYILGPYGDEIVIDCCRVIDLRTQGVTGVTGEPCPEPPDPWCSDVYVPRTGTNVLHVAVKYLECATRPVRVQPIGCGCDDATCEYSRWRDGYEIGFIDDCPVSSETPPSLDSVIGNGAPQCRPCPDSPWVVLAEVVVDGNGVIQNINNCKCRRLVVSFADFWWKCTGSSVTITGVRADPPLRSDNKAATNSKVTVDGKGFADSVEVSVGGGLTASNLELAPDKSKFTFTLNIPMGAKPGKWPLVVKNRDCSIATTTIEIPAPEAEPCPDDTDDGQDTTPEGSAPRAATRRRGRGPT
jgi:hypothetical protein